MKNTLCGLGLFLGLMAGLGVRLRADGTTGFSLLIQSSGTPIGAAVGMNCGTNLTCSLKGGFVQVSASGGGSGITALTQDVAASGSGSVAATVQGLEAVPFCSGYSPSNTQFIQYTTGGSPNPCYSSASGGGSGSFSAAPPYYYDGTKYYVAASGYTATKPNTSPTWINSVTPTTQTAGANGDFLFAGAGSAPYWQEQTATASAEVELTFAGIISTGSQQYTFGGAWLWDSTNSKIYALSCVQESDTNAPAFTYALNSYSYNGSGNPGSGSGVTTWQSPGPGICHVKLSVAGGVLTPQISLDGGGAYYSMSTVGSIGTISDGGFMGGGAASGTGIVDILSSKIN